MRQRVSTAIILLAVVFLGFAFPALRFLPVLLAAWLGLVCIQELQAMFRPQGIMISRAVGFFLIAGMVLEAWRHDVAGSTLVLGLGVPLAFLVRMRTGGVEGAWRDVSATVAAALYVGLPLAVLIELFMLNGHGRAWLLFMLMVVWCTDSSAMFVGERFGRGKIFPVLSPGKTWEGSAGGMAGALIPGLLVSGIYPAALPGVSSLELALVSLGMGFLTQAGDLSESLLKRDARVKDSGTALAGHGGALDRIDSILFVAMPFYLYLRLGQPGIFMAVS